MIGTGSRWSIGELARACGMTVRALHHYDEIGLLRASERTASGHRRYTEADLRRLYRVRALRSLGLSLEEISAALDDLGHGLAGMRDLLGAQLEALDVHAERIDRLRHQLRQLLEGMEPPDPDQFMTTLELMTMVETAFTPQQWEQLEERRTALGSDTVAALKEEWLELVRDLLEHVQIGTSVIDPAVRALVVRWDELGTRFHPDGQAGEQTRAAARALWQHNSDDLSRGLPWTPDQLRDLVHYLERVRRSG